MIECGVLALWCVLHLLAMLIATVCSGESLARPLRKCSDVQIGASVSGVYWRNPTLFYYTGQIVQIVEYVRICLYAQSFPLMRQHGRGDSIGGAIDGRVKPDSNQEYAS